MIKHDKSFFTGWMKEFRMNGLLFRCEPQLEGKVKDIITQRCECDQCGEQTMTEWVYTLIETGERVHHKVYSRCNKCLSKVVETNTSIEMSEKRKNVIKDRWLHITHPDAGFKNYLDNNGVRKNAKKVAMDYTKGILAGEKKSLLMMGSTGTGKTHLASAIAKTLDHEGFTVGFISSVELFKRLKDTFGKGGAETALFDEMRALDVLVIDDVGVETTKANSEIAWSISKWTEIIENRLKLSNVWTTNFDETSIYKVIGERAVSRMYENAIHINLFTDDYRKRGK